jgi:hypothetical protein
VAFAKESGKKRGDAASTLSSRDTQAPAGGARSDLTTPK